MYGLVRQLADRQLNNDPGRGSRLRALAAKTTVFAASSAFASDQNRGPEHGVRNATDNAANDYRNGADTGRSEECSDCRPDQYDQYTESPVKFGRIRSVCLKLAGWDPAVVRGAAERAAREKADAIRDREFWEEFKDRLVNNPPLVTGPHERPEP